MNGTDILILINGEVVGSQRDASFEETNEEIDVSSKTGGRHSHTEYGRYSATGSFDALYVPSDTAYLAIKAAVRAGTKVTVRRQEEGAALEECEAVLTSLRGEAPDQDAATISVSYTLDGEWEEVTT